LAQTPGYFLRVRWFEMLSARLHNHRIHDVGRIYLTGNQVTGRFTISELVLDEIVKLVQKPLIDSCLRPISRRCHGNLWQAQAGWCTGWRLPERSHERRRKPSATSNTPKRIAYAPIHRASASAPAPGNSASNIPSAIEATPLSTSSHS